MSKNPSHGLRATKERVKKIGRCRWQRCVSLRRSWLKQIHTRTAATSSSAWPCGHPLLCSHQWSSGWRSVLQLRSCAHERCVNEIPDLMQGAPRVNRNAEQVLFSFLGFEPHACCDLRKKLVWRSVHFEQLLQHVLLFGNRWFVHDGKKLVLPLDDGLLLLVRLGQVDY